MIRLKSKMAAPMEKHDFVEYGIEDDRLCELACTVVTGFENVATADIEEKLGVKAEMLGRGNLSMFVPFSQVRKVRVCSIFGKLLSCSRNIRIQPHYSISIQNLL